MTEALGEGGAPLFPYDESVGAVEGSTSAEPKAGNPDDAEPQAEAVTEGGAQFVAVGDMSVFGAVHRPDIGTVEGSDEEGFHNPLVIDPHALAHQVVSDVVDIDPEEALKEKRL